uniref:Protein MANBAL-like n=1 Tax=Crassostrea virginica TaxID=6565 RepID=A0A8B8B5A5_CRAVI|nr:protein MANBAL-like [Crassostrea virginica]
MAIEIEEPTLFENILQYGLFAAAIFQIICIMAAILIPKSESEQDNEEELKQPSNAATSSQTSRLKTKKEKKKNR